MGQRYNGDYRDKILNNKGKSEEVGGIFPSNTNSRGETDRQNSHNGNRRRTMLHESIREEHKFGDRIKKGWQGFKKVAGAVAPVIKFVPGIGQIAGAVAKGISDLPFKDGEQVKGRRK